MKLIDILLENITPEQWPNEYPFAVQDRCTKLVYFYDEIPKVNKEGKCFAYTTIGSCKLLVTQDLPMGKKWSKNIVNRDEFVERYNNEVKGFIENTGSMPVLASGTRVDVQYRNGLYNYHVTAGIRATNGSIPGKCAADWGITQNEYDIIRYRVCPLTGEEKLTK